MALQSILTRFKTGLAIAKASLGVLRREKWLLAFPALYGLAYVVGMIGLVGGLLAALFGVGYGLTLLEGMVTVSEGTGETLVTVLALAASFGFMFVATSVATFFSAALVHSVGTVFAGERTSLSDGLAGAWESKRTILAWGVVGAVVGMVFRALESQDGWGAQIVRALAGAAWFMMTFFVVPVIVFQDGGVRESLRESVSLFRETWGETGGVTLGIGLVIVPLILATLAAGIGAPLLLAAEPAAVLVYTIVPTVLIVGALLVVYNAAVTIAKTALYAYATDGELPEEFDGIDPNAITKPKRSSSGMLGGTTGQKPGQI